MISIRSGAWTACLSVALGICITWGMMPALDSSPLLRVGLFAILGILCPALVFLFPNTRGKTSAFLLVGGALLLRAALLTAPVSDDVNRYLWEGRLVLQGENPYSVVADDPSREPFRDSYWERMNHREMNTVYPPGIQWIFSAAVAMDYRPWTIKALAVAGDLVTLALLLVLLRRERLPTRWAGFYAFNPVVLTAFAAEAHFDGLMTACVLGTLLAAGSRKHAVAWLLLGMAIQIKLVALLIVPLLLNRRNIRLVWVLAIALTLPSLPFLSAADEWWHGIRAFADWGSFFAPLRALLSFLEFTPANARLLSRGVFVVALLAIITARWRGLPLVEACLATFAALLICSPILHFWHLTWLLPLAVLRPSLGWMTASITCAGYFLAWWNSPDQASWGFGHDTALWLWLPVLLGFVIQYRGLPWRIAALLTRKDPATPGKRLSVVVPTLNAGPRLARLVDSIRAELPADVPIVIVDGGSTDGSLNGIRETVIHSERGRGSQIAAGLSACDADWVLVAHADTVPSAGWYSRLREAIVKNPDAAMFVMGQRFDVQGPGLLLVEALNEARTVFGGVAFGDQTMVLRQVAMADAGGFPNQPLMEDVESSLRLQREGRIVYLADEWDVSASKWRGAFPRRFLLVLRIVFLYQIIRLRGRDAAAGFSQRLYQDYYGTRA